MCEEVSSVFISCVYGGIHITFLNTSSHLFFLLRLHLSPQRTHFSEFTMVVKPQVLLQCAVCILLIASVAILFYISMHVTML